MDPASTTFTVRLYARCYAIAGRACCRLALAFLHPAVMLLAMVGIIVACCLPLEHTIVRPIIGFGGLSVVTVMSSRHNLCSEIGVLAVKG